MTSYPADTRHGDSDMSATEDVQPDQQQAVIEAVEVAAERGLPLVADLVDENDSRQKQKDAKTGAQSTLHKPSSTEPTLPHAAPWMNLPPDALEKVRNVDIMLALASIAPRMKLVESEIERLITTPVKLIADVASHTLGAGGKRLRPALTLLAAQLCGDDSDNPDPRVVTCAAAVELTHTTTLLHDDVVDEAETRRGRPTANLIWGNETSVLVGDYLFAQVFVTASQKGFVELMQPLAVATAQMCAGELLETQTRGYLEMKEKQYLDIIALKTASLTDCACRLGAMAMHAPAEQVEHLARFGRDIGLAFQIVDDVFDVTASEKRMGKPVGQDIREGDITLPLLRALQVCTPEEAAELRAIVGKLPIEDAEVERALEIIRSTDAVDYSLQAATRFVASAQNQLEFFPDNPARAMLAGIADYVMSRER